MSHYYDPNPDSPHDIRRIEFTILSKKLIFDSDNGVFSKEHIDPGSKILIDAVVASLSDISEDIKILDLGCGYGPIGISLATLFPFVSIVMSDINERAVSLANSNIKLNHLSNIRAIVSDGMSALNDNFSIIVSNPPIRTGKDILYSMWKDCYDHLTENGRLYLVIRKKQGSDSAKKYLTQLFGNCETIERASGYHVLLASKTSVENEL